MGFEFSKHKSHSDRHHRTQQVVGRRRGKQSPSKLVWVDYKYNWGINLPVEYCMHLEEGTVHVHAPANAISHFIVSLIRLFFYCTMHDKKAPKQLQKFSILEYREELTRQLAFLNEYGQS